MTRYKLTIAYDGTLYCGWQVQINGPSIQALVQKALETLLGHPIDLTGAGRTDSGVHALGQTAHFDTSKKINPSKIRLSLNALLPPDIRILSAEPSAAAFHARYSASSKIYHYHLGFVPDPFLRLYRTFLSSPPDPNHLRKAAALFVGTKDFASFTNTRSGLVAGDTLRSLFRLDVVEEDGGVRLEFEGDGFLYKMIRNITGTLVECAKGKLSLQEIESMFSLRDRRKAGFCAPPEGLFLMEVVYERERLEMERSFFERHPEQRVVLGADEHG